MLHRHPCIVALTFTALLGCGGKTLDGSPSGQEPPSSCQNQVGDKPIQHACSHTTNGPFENVVAAANSASAPTVDAIHVSYLVGPPLGDEGSAEAFVTFTPSRDGEHLFLLDVARRFEVRESGDVLDPLFAGNIDGCDTAHYGQVYTLESGAHYLIELPSLTDPPALLFFEHLATFGDGAWQEGCIEGE